MLIETSQLQTLVAVAKSKSFSKAADYLNVTQSAISQSIKNLEKKVKVKIFLRAGKKVILTLEGEKIYNLAESFLYKMETTLFELQKERDSMAGKVRVGTLTGIGKSWLAPTLLEFAQEYPDLSLSLVLDHHEKLVTDFNNFRLDFLILPEESLPSNGQRMLIGEEFCMLVYPDKENFTLSQDLTLEELSSYPTILFEEEGDGLYIKWCREKFGKIPKNVRPRYTINSHGNMLQAVHKGLGLAVIPRHVLKRSYYKDKVKIFDSNEGVSNGKFFLVYHKETEDLVRMKKTLEHLTKGQNPLFFN